MKIKDLLARAAGLFGKGENSSPAEPPVYDLRNLHFRMAASAALYVPLLDVRARNEEFIKRHDASLRDLWSRPQDWQNIITLNKSIQSLGQGGGMSVTPSRSSSWESSRSSDDSVALGITAGIGLYGALDI